MGRKQYIQIATSYDSRDFQRALRDLSNDAMTKVDTFPDTPTDSGNVSDYVFSTSGKIIGVHNDDQWRFIKTANNLQGSELEVQNITASAILALTTDLLLATGTITVTLPKSSLSPIKEFIIKNIGVGTVTVDGFKAETIDGSTTKTLAADAFIGIVPNSGNWIIVR